MSIQARFSLSWSSNGLVESVQVVDSSATAAVVRLRLFNCISLALGTSCEASRDVVTCLCNFLASIASLDTREEWSDSKRFGECRPRLDQLLSILWSARRCVRILESFGLERVTSCLLTDGFDAETRTLEEVVTSMGSWFSFASDEQSTRALRAVEAAQRSIVDEEARELSRFCVGASNLNLNCCRENNDGLGLAENGHFGR